MTITMHLNTKTCTQCGLCAEICPALAIDYKKGNYPRQNSKRADICIECCQCMAICPSKSIVIGDYSYERDFIDITHEHIDESLFYNFISSRRSIRTFKDKPVPREMLEKIVHAITQAPMGFPPHKTSVTIVQERVVLDQILPFILDFFEKMFHAFNQPISRYFIKRGAGIEAFNTLSNHLMPILKVKLPDMKRGGKDEITRGAPVLFLFHAAKDAENHTQDANIAMTYGLLAAHALGLGATAIGLISPAINRTPELKKILQIPSEQEVVTSMIVGYAKYRYQRGIRRQLAGVNWI